jgi:hypothetical protein
MRCRRLKPVSIADSERTVGATIFYMEENQ